MGSVRPIVPLRLAIGVLALLLYLPACQRKSLPVDEPGTLSWALPAARTFHAGTEGLAETSAGEASAIRVGAVAARESGEVVVALEGWGRASIAALPGGGRLRLVQERLPQLLGLRVGGLWPRPDGFLLQTFRDPFADAAPRASTSIRPGLLGLGTGSSVELDPYFLAAPRAEGFELFALLPDPAAAGAWLCQFRSEGAKEPGSLYFFLPSLDSSAPRPITKAGFEGALAPRSLSLAPAPLRLALASLATGDDSAYLLRDSSDGSRSWYYFGKDPSSSREYVAWSDEKGRTLAFSSAGGGAFADGLSGQLIPLSLPPPEAGAFVTGCAFVELPGATPAVLIVVAWQGDRGDSSGIAVFPLALPSGQPGAL